MLPCARLASSAGLGLLAQRATSAAKEPIRIVFVARVQNVYDPGESLHEAIHVGDLMRGTMTYDGATLGSTPRPGVGRYEFRQAPFVRMARYFGAARKLV